MAKDLLTPSNNTWYLDSPEDSVWIISSAFVVFTMQSGFGLLESGSVSSKNEVNIMVKNAIDVIVGGLSFWMFGFALVYGNEEDEQSSYYGWGRFFVNSRSEDVGWIYSKFFFTSSFATTATTIVSGAMAERTKLESYIIFSCLNTFTFSIVAHWEWARRGWLTELGIVDFAGAGPVHIVGGTTSLIAVLMLGPRRGRFLTTNQAAFGSPTNAVLGMFMLWWGWLGFNCGSTFGTSKTRWILTARAAVSTIISSVAGGLTGIVLSYILKSRKFVLDYIINSVLGSLVAITALCAQASPLDGVAIGVVAGILSCMFMELLIKLKIDDPVSCFSVHAVNGVWGLLAVGLFCRQDIFHHQDDKFNVGNGLFWGGSAEILKVQAIGAVAITIWSVVVSYIFLKFVQITVGLRVSEEEEIIGADIVEHNCGGYFYDKKTKTLINLNEPKSEMRGDDDEDDEDDDNDGDGGGGGDGGGVGGEYSSREEVTGIQGDEPDLERKRKGTQKRPVYRKYLENLCPKTCSNRIYFSEKGQMTISQENDFKCCLKQKRQRKSLIGSLKSFRNIFRNKNIKETSSGSAANNPCLPSLNTLAVDNMAFDDIRSIQEHRDNLPNTSSSQAVIASTMAMVEGGIDTRNQLKVEDGHNTGNQYKEADEGTNNTGNQYTVFTVENEKKYFKTNNSNTNDIDIRKRAPSTLYPYTNHLLYLQNTRL
ncbi:putative ammonium transporter 3 [Argonauta hians]